MDFGAAVTVCGPSMTVRWATKANSIASEAVMVRQPLDMKFPLFRGLKDTESRGRCFGASGVLEGCFKDLLRSPVSDALRGVLSILDEAVSHSSLPNRASAMSSLEPVLGFWSFPAARPSRMSLRSSPPAGWLSLRGVDTFWSNPTILAPLFQTSFHCRFL